LAETHDYKKGEGKRRKTTTLPKHRGKETQDNNSAVPNRPQGHEAAIGWKKGEKKGGNRLCGTALPGKRGRRLTA